MEDTFPGKEDLIRKLMVQMGMHDGELGGFEGKMIGAAVGGIPVMGTI